MKNAVYTLGTVIENDTYYTVTEKLLHVYPEHTVKANEKKYFSMYPNEGVDSFDCFLYLRNKKNVTLDFCGAEIVLHGKMLPILLDGCENVVLKNLSVRYSRPFFTEGVIAEVGENYVVLDIPSRYTYRIEDGDFIPTGEGWESRHIGIAASHWFQVFDPVTHYGCGLSLGAIAKNVIVADPDFPFPSEEYVASEQNGMLRLDGVCPPTWQKGRVLCFSHEARTHQGIAVYHSEDIVLESIRFFDAPGMGIFPVHTKNIALRGVKMTHDEQSDSIVACMADGIHAIACSGEFEISDSIIEGSLDDTLNIHSNFYSVVCASENRLMARASLYTVMGIYAPNDKIAVYKGPTLDKVAEYTVIGTEPVEGDPFGLYLILDRPVLAHKEGDLIENISAQCNISIKRSRFSRANSHMRFQTRGKITVEDSEIGVPLMLTGDCSYWFESSPVNDMTVKNTIFSTERAFISIKPEFMPTENAPYYHENVKFIGNRFVTDTPIVGGYTDAIVFRDNVNVENKPMKLILTNCGTVDTDCEVVRKTEVKTELKVN
jgi:hypothetical protein